MTTSSPPRRPSAGRVGRSRTTSGATSALADGDAVAAPTRYFLVACERRRASAAAKRSLGAGDASAHVHVLPAPSAGDDQRRAFVVRETYAHALDAAAKPPGGVLRRVAHLAANTRESYPYCATHQRQRIDAEPCQRCRIAVLELALGEERRRVAAMSRVLDDMVPRVLSLSDTLSLWTQTMRGDETLPRTPSPPTTSSSTPFDEAAAAAPASPAKRARSSIL